ncbi:MAG: hypothetical protein ACRDVK_10610, partial [Acidimicrobiia bacterium]
MGRFLTPLFRRSIWNRFALDVVQVPTDDPKEYVMSPRTSHHRSKTFRAATFLAVVLVLTLGAAPALACGGLVGENGTIQLVR